MISFLKIFCVFVILHTTTFSLVAFSGEIYFLTSEKNTTSLNTLQQIQKDNHQSKTLKLVTPPYQKEIISLTPTFRWCPLPFESVEYRILISKPNGKIVIDEWIKHDTSFTISPTEPLQDLTLYYWMVYGYKNQSQFCRRGRKPVPLWIAGYQISDAANEYHQESNERYPGRRHMEIKDPLDNSHGSFIGRH